MVAAPARLVVVTLNIWGLLLVSRRREERVASIAQEIAKSRADVVALQEVWVSTDALKVATAAADHGLIHSHLFKSGLFGPGLMVLSRYPIVDAAFHPFAAAGDPTKFFQGDFYGTKGIGYAKLQLPSAEHLVQGGRESPQHVHVLVTHTHANYLGTATPVRDGSTEALMDDNAVALMEGAVSLIDPTVMVPLDEDSGFRLSNMIQLGHLASALGSSPHSFVVVAGDLNSTPKSLEMALLRELAPCLADPWEALHPSDAGWTCNVPTNSWSKATNAGIRIDYVLSTKAAYTARILSNRTAGGQSLSDHEALQVELDPGRPQQPRCPPPSKHKVLFCLSSPGQALAPAACSHPAGGTQPACHTTEVDVI